MTEGADVTVPKDPAAVKVADLHDPIVGPLAEYELPNGERIRKVLDLNIAASIDRAVAAMKPDQHILVTGEYDLDGNRAVASIVYRHELWGGDWSFVAAVDKPAKSGFGASVAMRWAK